MPKVVENENPKSVSDAAEAVLESIDCAYYERQSEARILMLATICREHVLFLGPPGTGKTSLVTEYARCLNVKDAEIFEYLFAKTTTPDEVFGPLDFALYEQGTCKRVTTGKLPEAKVAVLDECFKANSAILNNLLTILNERKYDNPDRATVPLEIAVGMSNELPEGGPSGELQALYDRFLFRKWVEPIKSRSNFLSLMDNPSEPQIGVRISDSDLAELRSKVKGVTLNQAMLDLLWDIKEELEADHQVIASTRRWKKCVKAIRASAVLRGSDVAEEVDLMVLRDCLWDEPDQRAAINGVVVKYADKDLMEALTIYDSAIELFSEFPKDEDSDEVFAANSIRIYKRMSELSKMLGGLTSTPEVAKIQEQVSELHQSMLRSQNRRYGI